jgi:ribosomal protein S1
MAVNSDNEWTILKSALSLGTRVRGIVRGHEVFGIFVRIPNTPFDGLVQITDFKDEGRMTVEEYPVIGSEIDAVVLGFRDSNQTIWLGMKPSQLAANQ